MAIEDFGIPMDYQPNLGFSQHELRETAVYGWFKREHHATPMGLYDYMGFTPTFSKATWNSKDGVVR